jgi:hypothetical protein
MKIWIEVHVLSQASRAENRQAQFCAMRHGIRLRCMGAAGARRVTYPAAGMMTFILNTDNHKWTQIKEQFFPTGHIGRNLALSPFFSLSSPKGGEGRGEEVNGF